MSAPSDAGLRLQGIRVRAGLTQRQLAKLAGVSPSYVGHVESGRVQQPSADLCKALCKPLGCPVEHLMLGVGEAPTDDQIRTALADVGFQEESQGAA